MEIWVGIVTLLLVFATWALYRLIAFLEPSA
jgi:hypothetical protein